MLIENAEKHPDLGLRGMRVLLSLMALKITVRARSGVPQRNAVHTALSAKASIATVKSS